MLDCPVTLASDENGTVLLPFANVHEPIAFGAGQNKALLQAINMLERVLTFCIDARKPLPISNTSLGTSFLQHDHDCWPQPERFGLQSQACGHRMMCHFRNRPGPNICAVNPNDAACAGTASPRTSAAPISPIAGDV